MNTQEAYEQIRDYFSKPGAVLARKDSGICAYRTPDGDKCAVGCLIPDEVYDSGLEGSSFDSRWLANFPYFAGMVHHVDKQFLRSAQILHDQCAKDARGFVAGLDALAMAYGLDTYNSTLVYS